MQGIALQLVSERRNLPPSQIIWHGELQSQMRLNKIMNIVILADFFFFFTSAQLQLNYELQVQYHVKFSKIHSLNKKQLPWPIY